MKLHINLLPRRPGFIRRTRRRARRKVYIEAEYLQMPLMIVLLGITSFIGGMIARDSFDGLTVRWLWLSLTVSVTALTIAVFMTVRANSVHLRIESRGAVRELADRMVRWSLCFASIAMLLITTGLYGPWVTLKPTAMQHLGATAAFCMSIGLLLNMIYREQRM